MGRAQKPQPKDYDLMLSLQARISKGEKLSYLENMLLIRLQQWFYGGK